MFDIMNFYYYNQVQLIESNEFRESRNYWMEISTIGTRILILLADKILLSTPTEAGSRVVDLRGGVICTHGLLSLRTEVQDFRRGYRSMRK